ncbi:hypothetical protein SLE2022_336340 [Rubroshorea leprosula]
MSGDRQIDPTVVHPSIALLQERFRQLERAKEMRQEEELLRTFPESREASMQSRNTQVQAIQTPLLEHLWSRDTIMCTTYHDDISDVDTSLHL